MIYEIGGYLELDEYSGSVFHEDAMALNAGRTALRYLIKAKNISKLHLPFFICNSVIDACKAENITFSFYHINADFRTLFEKRLEANEWLYIVNFYGQISNHEIKILKDEHTRIIVDNAHAYFQRPVSKVDTLYTCRKFLGVSDGAFLYTNVQLEGLERDESYERIRFVIGRYERSANEFYQESVENNDLFSNEPIKLMSRLTNNILRAIDYSKAEKKRTENYSFLHEQLYDQNKLNLNIPVGAYMYPFYCEDGLLVRKKLQAHKVYIPTLWPEVIVNCPNEYLEYDYAANILPLPVDQRYDIKDMKYVLDLLLEYGAII